MPANGLMARGWCALMALATVVTTIPLLLLQVLWRFFPFTPPWFPRLGRRRELRIFCWRNGSYKHNRGIPTHEGRRDERYLRGRVSFLSKKELKNIKFGEYLGSGYFSSVWKVEYEGKDAVVKGMKDRGAVVPLLREARLMVESQGAGGVPEVLGICLRPASMIQAFVGRTFNEYLCVCSVGDLLSSFVSIARRIGELHDLGLVHNDIRTNNITFTGSPREPLFHLIDFGLACRFGQVPGEVWLNGCSSSSTNGGRGTRTLGYYKYGWLSPEVRSHRPAFPSSDVYSFGFLLNYVAEGCKDGFLKQPLSGVATLCMPLHPSLRCSLTCACEGIIIISEGLTRRQLKRTLRFTTPSL